MSWPFLLTSLVIVATPGTGVVYTLNAGLLRGRRAAAWAALACTLGVVPHLAAAISGLAALLHASTAAYEVLVWAGVAYLVFMARGTWRSATVDRVTVQDLPSTPGRDVTGAATPGSFGPPAHVRAVAAPPGPRGVLRDGVVLNLVNPKLTVFFFAFLPQFTDATEPLQASVQTGLLGVVFMGLTWAVFSAYGVSAALLRPVLVRRPGLLGTASRGFAVCYLLLALGLAVQHLW